MIGRVEVAQSQTQIAPHISGVGIPGAEEVDARDKEEQVLGIIRHQRHERIEIRRLTLVPQSVQALVADPPLHVIDRPQGGKSRDLPLVVVPAIVLGGVIAADLRGSPALTLRGIPAPAAVVLKDGFRVDRGLILGLTHPATRRTGRRMAHADQALFRILGRLAASGRHPSPIRALSQCSAGHKCGRHGSQPALPGLLH